MLNILPQSPACNRGPWEKAEEFERSLAQAGREVYIIAGGAGSEGEIKGIDVPESTWKVIVAFHGKAHVQSGRSWSCAGESARQWDVAAMRVRSAESEDTEPTMASV
jgi:DNA/RNA endonuclease G (NUC1)